MIPAGVELFALDSAFFGFLAFEQVQGEAAQGGEIFRRETGAGAAVIFAKAHIQDPVEFVFHALVTAHRPRKGLDLERQTRQVVAALDRPFAAEFPDGFHHADRAQSVPFGRIGKPG